VSLKIVCSLPAPGGAAAVLAALEQHHAQGRVEFRGLALFHALGRAHQALGLGAKPAFLAWAGCHVEQRQGRQEQQLHPPAGVPAAEHARREHPGIVCDQQRSPWIPPGQDLGQVREAQVFGRAFGAAVDHQQP
jgi:hypothetical protein